jgi:hypothetical protein
MHLTKLIVVILAAAANVYAATSDFTRPAWILDNMKKLGIEERWLPTLGMLKALGALGLLVGTVIPWIGVAAAAGLVLFFVGAIITTIRAHWYGHVPFPLVWLALAVGALVLQLHAV